jgi:hypothetical protein
MDHGGFQGYGPPRGDAAAPVAAGRPDGVLGKMPWMVMVSRD